MADKSANRLALANIKPGAPESEVSAAYGDAWKAPPAHREGYVLSIQGSDGVTARMTRDGQLGSIRYDWRFTGYKVLGLEMGAFWPEIERRFNGIDPSGLAIKPFAWLSYVESPKLHVTMEIGTTASDERYLSWIELFDPAAVYPAKQPISYPTPVGARGAPFADVNLKLFVLSQLIYDGHLDIGEPQDLYNHVLGRVFDLDKEGYELVPEALDYLAHYPLSPNLLAKVTDLEFDGSAEIISFINYFWGGESDEYDVRSFEGIEALPNLRRLRIISMVDIDSADLNALKQRGIEID
jgi:hypothetical protein